MSAEVTDEIEMRCETGFMQHPEGIAADRKHATGFNAVMLVQIESQWLIGHGTAIDHGLPMIFAGILQCGDPE